MSDRRVKLILEAQVDRYKAAMSAAARSTEELEKAAKETDSSVAKRTKALRELSPLLLGVGTAALAGLGTATKAAMDWESAWTGVMKTVDGTPAQLAAVEEGLRGLARELPASHTEIAAVAEAAGQLGVATPDVVDFTRTMINLGEATNLTAEEAATTLARFANVMGTSTSDMENLGAAIVGLGNSYATTESEIAAMGQRLSGAGRQIGLSEGEVLGLAAAMSSVGIEAEAGGTAMSMTMKRIQNAVAEGGDSLGLFAQTSGMSSAEFQQAWREDAGAALALFVEGLGEAGASGENVNGILTELGVTGQREADSLLRLSAEAENMGDAMRTGAEEFDKGSALVEEAQKRYETAESRIKIAWNTIKDAAIDAGAVILPAVAGIADTVANLVGWFADLPEPAQTALTVLTGVAGVAALGAGAFVRYAPAVNDAVGAFRELTGAAKKSGQPLTRTQRGLRRVGRAATGAAIAFAGLSTAAAVAEKAMGNETVSGSKVENALRGISDGADGAAAALDDAFVGVSKTGNDSFTAIDSLGGAVDRLYDKTANDRINDAFAFLPGVEGGANRAKGAIGEMDGALARMATSGAADDAAAGFELLFQKADALDVPVEDIIKLAPEYRDAILEVMTANGDTQVSQDELLRAMRNGAPAMEGAASGADVLGEALEEVGVSTDGVVESMDTFLEQLFAAGILTMNSRDAAAAYQEGLDGVDDALKTITDSGGKMGATLNKNETDFDLATDAGRLANETFQGLARGGMAEVKALAEEGVGQDVLQDKLGQTYEDLVTTGKRFGLTGGDAEELARKILGVPDGVDIDSWMDDEAKRTAEQTKAALDNIPSHVSTTIDTFRNNYLTEYYTRVNKVTEATSTRNNSGGRQLKAAGGSVTGPGTETSDSIPAMLSNGEYVLTAADVRAMGGPRAVDTLREDLHGSPSAAGMFSASGTPRVSGRELVSAPAAAAPVIKFPSALQLKLGPDGPVVMAELVREGERKLNRP